MTDEPIPAATLIVARDRPGAPPEILMVERAGGMAFAAGALVFPGGRIDDADRELANEIGADPAIIAAIRETLEETAIPVGLTPMPAADAALELQRKLLAGAPLRDLGLTLHPDALQPFARWVPQFHAVRRFDTMFYIAACPPGDWRPHVVEGECARAEWVLAAEVLHRAQRGEARLIFPTRRTLERLAQHTSTAAICADARTHPIEPISPWVEEHGGKSFITIPDHLGFPVTREPLDGLWRG